MLHRKLTGFLLAILVVSATAAWAGVPDLGLSHASILPAAAGGSVFNLPNGQGDPLTSAKLANGTVVNGTITLTLVDALGVPIPFYPFEDLWLETSGGNFAHCPNGTAANASTDIAGVTTWSNPLFAGGNSFGQTVVVMVAGSGLNQAGLNLLFNSADIDGSLAVNLGDVTLFSFDFTHTYNYRSDFVRDGAINLGDVTQMARGNGAACP
jgi:hypothetical protein